MADQGIWRRDEATNGLPIFQSFDARGDRAAYDVDCSSAGADFLRPHIIP
jgi:hypothetical protein